MTSTRQAYLAWRCSPWRLTRGLAGKPRAGQSHVRIADNQQPRCHAPDVHQRRRTAIAKEDSEGRETPLPSTFLPRAPRVHH
jgi:hypothetical protein